MIYLIIYDKNRKSILLKLRKKGIENYFFFRKLTNAIEYFKCKNLKDAIFITDIVSFHKNYYDLYRNFESKTVILSKDFFFSNEINAIYFNREGLDLYCNDRNKFYDTDHPYLPLFSIDKTDSSYELNNYIPDGEIEKLYITYTKNYRNLYAHINEIEYSKLCEFETAFFKNHIPFVIIVEINSLDDLNFIYAFNKKNKYYYHYRFIIISNIIFDYDFALVYTKNKISYIFKYISNYEYVIIFKNLSFVPKLDRLNNTISNSNFIKSLEFICINFEDVVDKLNYAAFMDNELLPKNENLYTTMSKLLEKNTLFQEKTLDKLERLLKSRSINKGLQLVEKQLDKIYNIKQYVQFLMIKISFLIVAKNSKMLEVELVKAFTILKSHNESFLLDILVVCLSMEKDINQNVLKIIYKKIVSSIKIPDDKKLLTILKYLNLSPSVEEIKDIISSLSSIKREGNEKIYSIIIKIMKEIVVRKYSCDNPELLVDLYNMTDNHITVLKSLKNKSEYDKMKSFNSDELIFHICTSYNQYEPEQHVILKRRQEILKSLKVILDNINLNILLDDIIRFDVGNFGLSYDGESSKDIFVQKSLIFRKICPDLNYSVNRELTQVKKIAFISDFLNRIHSVYKDRHMVINFLSFHYDVYIYTQHELDNTVKYTFGKAKHFILPEKLSQMRDLLIKENFDIIVYPEIGMNPMFYFLAHLRLAPVQINTWGHSDTSGINTIDYYISSEYFELPNAQDFYSEKLIKLESLSTCYKNPLSYVKPYRFHSRYDFGFSKEVNIYLCPQSLFKFKPLFETYLIEILEKDKNGVLVLLDSFKHKSKLIKRIEKNGKDIVSRICFVPGLSHQEFMGLINICDVLLDTYPFGSCNTSFEAFSLGKPIVTQPGKLINGRFTLGFYKKMEINDCIVYNKNDYIKLAVKLGTNKIFNQEISNKIKSKSNCLFLEEKSCKDWKSFINNLTSIKN